VNDLKAELQRLYSDASKHSVYQNIPDFVSAEIGYTEPIDEAWRGDRPRFSYLADVRAPKAGELWVDFGANTGFFSLSLARQYPRTSFVAVEANPNHSRFISRVAKYFSLDNVSVIERAIGMAQLAQLPRSDFLLHLNVLHHAGHDFDSAEVSTREGFPRYARSYLSLLREQTCGMLFQLGSNWGGDKRQPLVDVGDDALKLGTFSSWLRDAGWRVSAAAYARHEQNGSIRYYDLPPQLCSSLNSGRSLDAAEAGKAFRTLALDRFPGEFYRRPLFVCDAG
jgi:hypothetical protein